MNSEDDLIKPNGSPTALRWDKHGLRTTWKGVLLRYLAHDALGKLMQPGALTGEWATFRAHPYDYKTVSDLRKRIGKFGWEFASDHKCPHCNYGRSRGARRLKLRMVTSEHGPDCRWWNQRADQVWITFRRNTTGVSAEMLAEGMAWLNRKPGRRPRSERKESENAGDL